ncbi:MAG: hypothetical protein FWD60_04480 [Candidatus Azobacteroides sp.]|nr:hypothetical protein [Candidatus Azobacteroides sp.]
MIKKIVMFALLIGAMMCNYSCNRKMMSYSKFIKLDQESAANNFASVSLKKFVSSPENQGASVVVRNPYFRSNDATSDRYEQVCSMVQRGLMEQRYNSRDRQLYEKAVEKLPLGSNYVDIRKATGTDLIFEIAQFSTDEYVIDSYTTDNPADQGKSHPFGEYIKQEVGKKKVSVWVPYSYVMYGFSIEIKVILLADNLTAGTFKYYYTPCTDGATVTYFDSQILRYSDNKQNLVATESSRKESRTERYDKQISDFISGTVIPSLFKEMRGESVSSVSSIKENENTDTPITNHKKTEETQQKARQVTNPQNENTKVEKQQDQVDITKQTQRRIRRPMLMKKGTKEETQQNPVAVDNQTATDSQSSSPSPQKNSYSLVKAVSDLISHSMEDQQSKLKQDKKKEYKTDLERLSDLTFVKQQEIANFINSITTNTNTPLLAENEIAIFCKNENVRTDQSIIAFLNGMCVGVGSFKKGLFSSLPKDKYSTGIQTLTLYSCGFRLVKVFSSPINFSLKNYYSFEYNKGEYILSN